MADVQTINVGGEQGEQGKGKSKKPVWDLSSAVDTEGNAISLDDKGRLTGVPANYDTNYAPLKRSAFAEVGTFYDFKIFQAESRVAQLREAKAEALSPPDPKAKAVKRRARLQKQLAALEAQMAEEGIEL